MLSTGFESLDRIANCAQLMTENGHRRAAVQRSTQWSLKKRSNVYHMPFELTAKFFVDLVISVLSVLICALKVYVSTFGMHLFTMDHSFRNYPYACFERVNPEEAISDRHTFPTGTPCILILQAMYSQAQNFVTEGHSHVFW